MIIQIILCYNDSKFYKQSSEGSHSFIKCVKTLLHIFAHNFGSICLIFKIQLLAYSELLRAAIFCGHRAEIAKRNNKTHAKIKRYTVYSKPILYQHGKWPWGIFLVAPPGGHPA